MLGVLYAYMEEYIYIYIYKCDDSFLKTKPLQYVQNKNFKNVCDPYI